MKEDLLTTDEIKLILKEAENPVYKEPNMLHLGKQKTSIFKVSQITGLILFNGNESTGLEHINLRHCPSSKMPFWKEIGKLDNPSKFHFNLPPVRYMTFADKIFKKENFNKNKQSNIFDAYVGKASSSDFEEAEYTLVLYKSTKIIHTFYVSANKKPFNKKKILDLQQGFGHLSINPVICENTYKIPYRDQKGIERFVLILKSNEFTKQDYWFIQVNNQDSTPFLTTFICSSQIQLSFNPVSRLSDLEFGNLTWIEKEMKKMLDQNYKF